MGSQQKQGSGATKILGETMPEICHADAQRIQSVLENILLKNKITLAAMLKWLLQHSCPPRIYSHDVTPDSVIVKS